MQIKLEVELEQTPEEFRSFFEIAFKHTTRIFALYTLR